MKYILILVIAVINMAPAISQENLNPEENIETLICDNEYHSGGYGGLELKYVNMMGKNNVVIGGRGGWIINHTFSIGGAGYGLVTYPEITSYKNQPGYTEPYFLRTGWGGLFLQYINNSNSMIHFTVNSLIGAGAVSCSPKTTNNNKDPYDPYNSNYKIKDYPASTYFIFEPGIGIELNIFSFFRIEAGAGYRLTTGMDMNYMENSDISGASINLGFKFGNF